MSELYSLLARITRFLFVKMKPRPKRKLIYRAVSNDELEDLKINDLRNIPGAYETGKLFALTLTDAAKFGKNNFLLAKSSSVKL